MAFVELEIEVVFGRTDGHVHLRQIPAARERFDRRLDRKQRVEQRVRARAALDVERADQLVERHIGSAQRADHGGAHLAKIIAERRGPLRMAAQGHGVEEIAHQWLQFGPAPGIGHAADDDVAFAGIAEQHGLVGGQQHHIQRGAPGLRQQFQAFDQRRRQIKGFHAAGMGGVRRARAVARQFQPWQGLGQRLAPPGDLPRAFAIIGKIGLPHGIVGILQGGFGQW